MTRRKGTAQGESKGSVGKRLPRDGDRVIAAFQNMAAETAPFEGYSALGRAIGLGAQRIDYICRRLIAAGAVRIEKENFAEGGPRWRVILPNGSATGWGNCSRGVRHARQPMVAANHPAPPVDTEDAAVARRDAAAAEMAARRRAIIADAPPAAARPQIEVDAAAIEAAMARSFVGLVVLIDREKYAGQHSSWMKALAALAALVEAGAMCRDDERAEAGAT